MSTKRYLKTVFDLRSLELWNPFQEFIMFKIRGPPVQKVLVAVYIQFGSKFLQFFMKTGVLYI